MTASIEDLTSRLLSALNKEAAAAANAPATLASVTFDVLTDTVSPDYAIETQIVRATRTLVFSTAEMRNAGGAPIIAATAIHKIVR